MQKRALLVVLIELLYISASLSLVSIAAKASFLPDNEPPLQDGGSQYSSPIPYRLESATRAEMQEHIGDLNRQIEEMQAINYQTTILMYVFVAVSAFLVLMLMFFVMFRRPTPIVRTLR